MNLNGICWGFKGFTACSEFKECMECAVLSPSKFSLDEEKNYLRLSLLLSNFLIVSLKLTSILFLICFQETPYEDLDNLRGSCQVIWLYFVFHYSIEYKNEMGQEIFKGIMVNSLFLIKVGLK